MRISYGIDGEQMTGNFSRMLGVDKGTPSRWATGVATVPGSVALLLRSMVAGYVTPDQLDRLVEEDA